MSEVTEHKMPNGASVNDWLGTASLSARMASGYLESVRSGHASDEGHMIAQAHAQIQNAARAIGEIMQALEDAGLAAMA